MDPIGNLTLILLLAFLAEGLTEYFARPLFATKEPPTEEDARSPKGDLARLLPAPGAPGTRDPDAVPAPPPTVFSPMWLRYVSMLVGIALAFAYRADLLLWFGFAAWHPAIGMALTGILIGRGSNYMHDLVDRYFQPTPKPLDWL
jgi:hypothetical protein